MIIQFPDFVIKEWRLVEKHSQRDLIYNKDGQIRWAMDIRPTKKSNQYQLIYYQSLNFLNLRDIIGDIAIAKDIVSVQEQVDNELLRISKLASFI